MGVAGVEEVAGEFDRAPPPRYRPHAEGVLHDHTGRIPPLRHGRRLVERHSDELHLGDLVCFEGALELDGWICGLGGERRGSEVVVIWPVGEDEGEERRARNCQRVGRVRASSLNRACLVLRLQPSLKCG